MKTLNMATSTLTSFADDAAQTQSALSILSSLVRFDTVSRNSNLDLIDWVERYLTEHGVASRRFLDQTGKKASLFATIGPADRGGYVLSGHTDVVPVDNQLWSSNPFELRVENGKAYGRGTCDMKGFLACCLAAVPAFAAAPLRTPVHLAFSYDEEIGCVGVRPMLEWLAQEPHKPLGAVIGEPTCMEVVTGHKGKRSVRAVVRGAGAHSSLAPEAVNAVQYGARLVAHVAEIAERLKKTGKRDPLFDVVHSTAHVGVFKGGEALNIVPDHAEMVFEFRTIGADDPDALVAEIRNFTDHVLVPEMKAISPATGIDIDVYAGFPGLDTPEDAPVVTLAKAWGGRNDYAKVAYGTEAGLFTQMAGIPAVVMGPGSIAQAHKADEFITLAQIESCMTMLGRLKTSCLA
jgi:acetylornithine deacetylase